MADELGKNFIEQTKYQNMGLTPQKQGAAYPEYVQTASGKYPIIPLPKPEQSDLGHADLRTTIEQRTSVRRYTNDAISLDELSYLLWLTQGVKNILPNTVTMRTVPSAGARHPFETWLSINRVETVQAGLYHFLATTHELEAVRLGEEVNQKITQANLNQQQVATSAVTFIWVAHPYRTSWRYGSRAYRYIYLDAGHVCQNLHLAAEAIGCGVCAIGAYDDDAVNQLLELDGEEQFVIYMASLGRKITGEAA
jgi:SagB-type dehydrogenase family enzyme